MSNILAGVFLKSVTFVPSTFSKTETFCISLMFAMDVMIFRFVQSQSKMSTTELLAIRPTMSVIVCLNRTVQLINLDLCK